MLGMLGMDIYRICSCIRDRILAPQRSPGNVRVAWGKLPEIEQTRVQTAGRPSARFTQIIRTGPDELPEDEILVADGIPGIKPRTRLAP